jgi:glycosyltransferase involved in cell wall biosynthesis
MASIRAWRPDVVHVQFPTRGYGRSLAPHALPFLLERSGVPAVQTWHEPLSRLGRVRYLLNLLGRGPLVSVDQDNLRRLPAFYTRALVGREVLVIPIASNLPTVRLSALEREEVRARYGVGARRLLTFFGFVEPAKGVEDLFEAADPGRDFLAVAGAHDPESPYVRRLQDLTRSGLWRGASAFLGFLEPHDAARLLAASDAAVYPFREGAAARNGSVLAALAQGTPVVTTSLGRSGLEGRAGVVTVAPRDVAALRSALETAPPRPRPSGEDWSGVAGAHLDLYRRLLGARSARAVAASGAAGGGP